MWNIVVGIALVIGGLSGELVLIGTNSGGALAAVGAGFVVWGAVQIMSTSEEPPNPSETEPK